MVDRNSNAQTTTPSVSTFVGDGGVEQAPEFSEPCP
jgi:hypothetical protein